MKRRVFLLSIVVLIAVSFVGCRARVPVLNFEKISVPASSEDYTLIDMKRAIQRAVVKLGWQITNIEPGLIGAVLLLRRHRAEVDITYNRESYNIVYKGSENLKYEDTEQGPVIHPKYNSWIIRLNRRIQTELVEI